MQESFNQSEVMSGQTDQSKKEGYSSLNLGPTHPATHGIFQNILQMDGEVVHSSEQEVGYIHRAFEKIAERRPYYQITTLTDRLNYCSAPINNMGWHMTVEKLIRVQLPIRAEYLRMIIMELSRIADHLVCNSVIGVDAGALTGFTYAFQWREKIYEIFEEICGSRLTTNIGRIGGLERNFSEKTWDKVDNFIDQFPAAFNEFSRLLERSKIFYNRTYNVGLIDAERALNYGFTGPNLRATGIDYDVRVANSYSAYQTIDFTIPVGTRGDTYDRFMVRQEEVRQSFRIVQELRKKIKKLPGNEYHAKVPEFYLPAKEDVYSDMEALIWHFKIVMGEDEIPKGRFYHAVEGGNGELGFYLISDGGRTPYRLRFRRPCFIYYQAFAEMIKGQLLSDVVVTLSSLNVIAGELDA